MAKNKELFLKEICLAKLTKVEVFERILILQSKLEESSKLAIILRAGKPESKGSRGSFLADVVAAQMGFENDDILSEFFDSDALPEAQAERLIVFAAFAGRDETVDRLLAAHPSLAETSVAIALVLGRQEALNHLESAKVDTVIRPLDLSPLCYLLNSKYDSQNPKMHEVRLQITRKLLNLGASPNSGMYEMDSIRGYRTLLGMSVECQKSPELARILLKNGANIDDGPSLYEGSAMWAAVEQDDLPCLKVLTEHEPPLWHLCHALTHAISLYRLLMVRWLLEHEANPNWNQTIRGYKGNALHEAILISAPDSDLNLLIDKGAKLDFEDCIGRTPIGVATAMGATKVVDLLQQRGASTASIRAEDNWIGNIARSMDQEEQSISFENLDLRLEDHLWVHEAILRGDFQLAQELVQAGLDPLAVNYAGQTALHLAVAEGESELVETIMEKVGDRDIAITNFEGETPLSLCEMHLTLGSPTIVESLMAAKCYQTMPMSKGVRRATFSEMEAFEAAATAIAEGDLEELRDLFESHPRLSQLRSSRPHRCTLINYVGVNGFEGERQKTPENIVEVINFLIEQGCDPESTCFTYRGGPGENTIGLLTSSGVPASELQLPMVHALVKGGASVDKVTEFLVQLYDADQEGDVARYLAESDSNKKDRSVALIQAISMGQKSLALNLLNSDLDVNVKVGPGLTAIHQAAFIGDRELV
ncbi:MAG: ankyrin repeat domain-containing protein, partial [Gammaproteobacteria bacterium]|nr:ankyrin repeat domain-containing protein [Gammaproteobacteria bacterium]